MVGGCLRIAKIVLSRHPAFGINYTGDVLNRIAKTVTLDRLKVLRASPGEMMADRTLPLSMNQTGAAEATSQRSISPQEILRRRAEALAQSPRESLDATDLLEVIHFRIGRERFAIETKFVEEVIRAGTITPIPDSASILLGVMNLRGEILAVMDLGLLLNSTRSDEGESWIIVIGEQRTEFGVLVDAVTEVTNLRVSEILSANEHGDTTDTLMRGLTADTLLVLDGTALLEDQRLHIDDE